MFSMKIVLFALTTPDAYIAPPFVSALFCMNIFLSIGRVAVPMYAEEPPIYIAPPKVALFPINRFWVNSDAVVEWTEESLYIAPPFSAVFSLKVLLMQINDEDEVYNAPPFVIAEFLSKVLFIKVMSAL